MILITGDVHSSNICPREHLSSQVSQAVNYLKILDKYHLKSTLFLNGICFYDEKEQVKELLDFDVELGGHTFDNFGHLGKIKSYLYRKIFGCVYGSKGFQRRDIQKTKKAFESLGLKMNSWRTHAFGSNDKTFSILKSAGVRFVSDLVGQIKPSEKKGIIHLPINIPVDQNAIAYGKLKPENRDPFASCVKGRISGKEWFEILKKRVGKNEKRNRDSIILIHPETMATLDNFKLFEKIAKFLSKYESAKVSEIKLK